MVHVHLRCINLIVYAGCQRETSVASRGRGRAVVASHIKRRYVHSRSKAAPPQHRGRYCAGQVLRVVGWHASLVLLFGQHQRKERVDEAHSLSRWLQSRLIVIHDKALLLQLPHSFHVEHLA